MSITSLVVPASDESYDNSEEWIVEFRILAIFDEHYQVVSAAIGKAMRESGHETRLSSIVYNLSDKKELNNATSQVYMIYIENTGGKSEEECAKAIKDNLNIDLRNAVDKSGKSYWWRVVSPAKTYRKPNKISVPYESHSVRAGDPRNDRNENPWIDVLGTGDEAETAYWNTD